MLMRGRELRARATTRARTGRCDVFTCPTARCDVYDSPAAALYMSPGSRSAAAGVSASFYFCAVTETVYDLAGVTRFFENRAHIMRLTVFPVLPPPPDDDFFSDPIVELRKRATAIAPDASETCSRTVLM